MKVVFVLCLVALVILMLVFPSLRTAFIYLPHTIAYGCFDIYHYFHDHLYDDAKATTGKLICYEGLFGKGKTLCETMTVRRLYKRYNGKKIFKDGKWVMQRCVVLSNVTLNDIPYIPFETMGQMVQLAKATQEPCQHDSPEYVILYIIMDEMQMIMNSRKFKSNFASGSDVISVFVQLRKFHASIHYTSTSWTQTDAMIRQDTLSVCRCNKWWRLLSFKEYDAFQYENCYDPNDLKPLHKKCYFVFNKDYRAYDTMRLSEFITNEVTEGNMVSLVERNNSNTVNIHFKEHEKRTSRLLSRHKVRA